MITNPQVAAIYLSFLVMFILVAAMVSCKRAILAGMDNVHLSIWSNVCFLPLGLAGWFFSFPKISFQCWPILMAAVVYSIGWFLQNRAIQHSDVTMVAPLLGSKPILVAIIAAVWLSEYNSMSVFLAALLVIPGIYFVCLPDKQRKFESSKLGLILLASLCYAICDTAVKAGLRVLPVLSVVTILLTVVGLIHVPAAFILVRRKTQYSGMLWAMVTGILMVSVSYLMTATIKVGDNVTIPNIIIAMRGVFALPIIWFMDKYFKVTLEHQSKRTYIWRVVGCIILFAASAIVII